MKWNKTRNKKIKMSEHGTHVCEETERKRKVEQINKLVGAFTPIAIASTLCIAQMKKNAHEMLSPLHRVYCFKCKSMSSFILIHSVYTHMCRALGSIVKQNKSKIYRMALKVANDTFTVWYKTAQCRNETVVEKEQTKFVSFCTYNK